jgi:hypothetical protein
MNFLEIFDLTQIRMMREMAERMPAKIENISMAKKKLNS